MKKIMSQGDIQKRFENPVLKFQVVGNQFIELPDGEIALRDDFLGEKGYISFDQIVKEIKKSKKKVILNLGDSSTSGWDNEFVLMNQDLQRRNPKIDIDKKGYFPIFNYKTYSDIIKDKIGKNYIVINAGIPTHSSRSGVIRTKNLFDKFNSNNIKIDYATIYYGNNDCSYAPLEEKEKIKKSKNKLYFAKKKFILRVNPTDFIENMKKIINLCKENGAVPIVIEPVTSLYWEPARRVPRRAFEDYDDEDDNLKELKDSKTGKVIYNYYLKSINLWREGIKWSQKGNSKKAIKLLEKARELDFVTPRIKKQRIKILRELVKKLEVSYVKVDIPVKKNDTRLGESYFCDYCHPIEKANIIIANEIINQLNKFERKK